MKPPIDKINAFRLSSDKRFIIGGDCTGRIFSASLPDLTLCEIHHVHWGTVMAIAVRPDGYIATLSMDRTVALWRHDEGRLQLLHKYSLLDDKTAEMAPRENPNPVRSESQALCFSSHSKVIATRNAYGDLLLLNFDEDRLAPVACLQVSEAYDLVSVQFSKDGNSLLAGTIRGDIILLQDQKIKKTWKLEDYTVHWFEEIEPNVFLIAGDSRRIGKLDLNCSENELTYGEPFAADDFEHVTYNKISKCTLATSFDRNVYEICKDTLVSKRIVIEMPFKNRWIEFVDDNGYEALVQCRDGGLYLINIESSIIKKILKFTPDAIWSAVLNKKKDSLFIAGDMPDVHELQILDDQVKAINFLPVPKSLPQTYTKRIIFDETGDVKTLVGAQIDGTVFIIKNGERTTKKVSEKGIRDVAISSCLNFVYFVDEIGQAGKLGLLDDNIEILHRSEKPLRSLALSPDGEILALAERTGNVILIDTKNSKILHKEEQSRTAKRMKWLNNDCLLYNNATHIYKLDRRSMKSVKLTSYRSNTTEDFCWDPSERYIAYIGYSREVCLHDMKSGYLLDRVLDDNDYSKGIIWLGDSAFATLYGPACFATYGRNSCLNIYEIYEEKLRFVTRIENVGNRN